MNSPKDVMIGALQEWMRGDYGHDLPAEEFETEVERLAYALDAAGFAIVPKEPTEEMIQSALSEYAANGPWESPFGPDGSYANEYRAMIRVVPILDDRSVSGCPDCGQVPAGCQHPTCPMTAPQENTNPNLS